jgi:hypothetical protein
MIRSASVGQAAASSSSQREERCGQSSARGRAMASAMRLATCSGLWVGTRPLNSIGRPLVRSQAAKNSLVVRTGCTVVTAMRSPASSTRAASARDSWAALVAL